MNPFAVSRPVSARRGFTLIELLIIMAIVGILVAMLIPAVTRVRQAAKLADCENNLKQIGLACHAYHDIHLSFPLVLGTANNQPNFFRYLLPFLEEQNQKTSVDASGVSGATPIKTYMCPSRHQVKGIPGLDECFVDYGFADPGIHYGVSGFKTGAMGQFTIGRNPTRLADVSDGATNTLLLAHLGMAPGEYRGVETANYTASDWFGETAITRTLESNRIRTKPWVDLGSWMPANTFSKALTRYPLRMLRDSDTPHANLHANYLAYPAPSHHLLTSPHLSGMPCAWSDGSVRILSFSKDPVNEAQVGTPLAARPPLDAESQFNLNLWVINDGDQQPQGGSNGGGSSGGGGGSSGGGSNGGGSTTGGGSTGGA